MSASVATFTNLYDRMVNGRPILALFLPGHLAIELLLRKVILQRDPALASFVRKATHAILIAKAEELGAIDQAQASVLTMINRTRNKFAHEIAFEPTIEELKVIWNAAAAAFSDFTDGISQGIGSLEESNSIWDLEEWAFPELFVQICYDLHHTYIDGGGHYEDL